LLETTLGGKVSYGKEWGRLSRDGTKVKGCKWEKGGGQRTKHSNLLGTPPGGRGGAGRCAAQAGGEGVEGKGKGSNESRGGKGGYRGEKGTDR